MLKVEYEARRQGKKQTEIGQACGVTVSLVSRVMRGKEEPYPKLRDGIARALDWPIERADELFEEIVEVR